MITDKEWEKIQKELLTRSPHVKFLLDDVEVVIKRVEKSEGVYHPFVFLNGDCKREWFSNNELTTKAPAVAHLVYCKKKTALYAATTKKQISKELTKREIKSHYPDFNNQIEYLSPFHNKASSLIKQFRQVEDLIVLEIGDPIFDDPKKLTEYLTKVVAEDE
jgi:hypothetical protein